MEESSNLFSRSLDVIKLVKSEDGTILSRPFLDLCKLLVPLIDSFGSSMSCIKDDVVHNIVKLESKYTSNPSTYIDLYSMTKEEIIARASRNTSSCTYAFVWLNRAMDFMVELLSNLLEHPEWTMTQACTDSYKRTLKKWHGWMAVSTFKVLIKLAPERKRFVDSIGMNTQVNVEIDKLCKSFAPILDENHKFLARVGVDDLRAP